MSNGKMLILPGNDMLLHQKAATDYAALRGYEGEVLQIAGNSKDQEPKAIQKLEAENSPYTALYGFSGGGYHLRHILDQLTEATLKRIKLVVVLGSPPVYEVVDKDSGKKSFPNCSTDMKGNLSSSEKHSCSPLPDAYMANVYSAKFKNKDINWELVYWTNPDERGHMFGPDWLLAQELKKKSATQATP